MTRLRIVLATLAAVAALGLVGAGAVVTFGLFDTSARAGHWRITEWVLHTTFRNDIKRRAPPASAVPDLADPGLIALGARHYDSACRLCHARPGETAGATIAAMEPPPPQIEEAVRSWAPAELHRIVEHGAKMTGMPGWPAGGREDEVWAVVAFLMAVKGGMDGDGYDRLTAPHQGGYCAGCHGGELAHVPRLDILSGEYIASALAAYRSGARPSGIMAHAATRLPAFADARLARTFAGQEAAVPAPASGPAPEAAETGARIAREGRGKVPACVACHGPANANPLIPSLDGQREPYLVAQLRLWRDGRRGGADRAPLMAQAAHALEEQEIEALAAYFSRLSR
ncbi:c-type cytochrome [Pseudochelatococcus sp. B33]